MPRHLIQRARPEPYLAAAAALGVPAKRCTAVVGTTVGVAAATTAGMFTVDALVPPQPDVTTD